MTCYFPKNNLFLVDHDLRIATEVSVGQIVHVQLDTAHGTCTYPARLAEFSRKGNCVLVERLFTRLELHHLGLAPNAITAGPDAEFIRKSPRFAVALAMIRGPVFPALTQDDQDDQIDQDDLFLFPPHEANMVLEWKTGRPARKRRHPVREAESDVEEAKQRDPPPVQRKRNPKRKAKHIPQRNQSNRTSESESESDPEFEPELGSSQCEHFEFDGTTAASFREVDRIMPSDHNGLFSYSEGDDLWLADPTEKTKTKLVEGALLWVHKKHDEELGLFTATLEEIIYTRNPAGDSKLKILYYYSHADLVKAGFAEDELDAHSIQAASSNYSNKAKLSEVAGIDFATPQSEFFYDKDGDTLSGPVDEGCVVLTPRQVPPSSASHKPGRRHTTLRQHQTLEDQALVWAKVQPEEELATEFGKHMIHEFQLLTDFGNPNNVHDMVQRLKMIPHELVPERGLTPEGIHEWRIDEYYGRVVKGECAACGEKRPLSMELARFTTSSVLMIGTVCAKPLTCLLKCCKMLRDVRRLALKPRPPMEEIAKILRKISAGIIAYRRDKEDLCLLE